MATREELESVANTPLGQVTLLISAFPDKSGLLVSPLGDKERPVLVISRPEKLLRVRVERTEHGFAFVDDATGDPIDVDPRRAAMRIGLRLGLSLVQSWS